MRTLLEKAFTEKVFMKEKTIIGMNKKLLLVFVIVAGLLFLPRAYAFQIFNPNHEFTTNQNYILIDNNLTGNLGSFLTVQFNASANTIALTNPFTTLNDVLIAFQVADGLTLHSSNVTNLFLPQSMFNISKNIEALTSLRLKISDTGNIDGSNVAIITSIIYPNGTQRGFQKLITPTTSFQNFTAEFPVDATQGASIC